MPVIGSVIGHAYTETDQWESLYRACLKYLVFRYSFVFNVTPMVLNL